MSMQVILTEVPDGAVLVGVDGSDHSLAALRWAADEAVSRRTVLAIAHAAPDPLPAAGPSIGLEHAVRAPSVHNTQPWRWRIRDDSVELYADWTRHLPWTDPDRRDLLISCGAALHHLRVALARQGLAVAVDRFPDPDHEGHLAAVTIRPGQGDPAEASSTRRNIRNRILRAPEYPQLILRIGWPATHAAELPTTDRRDLSSVLLPNTK